MDAALEPNALCRARSDEIPSATFTGDRMCLPGNLLGWCEEDEEARNGRTG